MMKTAPHCLTALLLTMHMESIGANTLLSALRGRRVEDCPGQDNPDEWCRQEGGYGACANPGQSCYNDWRIDCYCASDYEKDDFYGCCHRDANELCRKYGDRARPKENRICYNNEDDCEFEHDEDPVFCTQEVRECRDGSFVSRVPPDCDFEPCPGDNGDGGEDGEDGVLCTQEVRECPDGSFVSRVPPDCDFEPCPGDNGDGGEDGDDGDGRDNDGKGNGNCDDHDFSCSHKPWHFCRDKLGEHGIPKAFRMCYNDANDCKCQSGYEYKDGRCERKGKR